VEGDVVQTDGGESLLNIPISAELPLTKTFNSPVKYSSGNILARWSHTTAGGSDLSLQLYDDYYVKRELGTRESPLLIRSTWSYRYFGRRLPA
jgi:hypothetical protein